MSRIIKPFFLFEAPSLVITATLESFETFTSLTILASTFTLSIFFMFSGLVTSHTYAVPLYPIVPDIP